MENFQSKVYQFNILNWNWMEFDLVIIEMSFCGGRLLIHIWNLKVFVVIPFILLVRYGNWYRLYIDLFSVKVPFLWKGIWFYRELCFKWHWFFNPVKDRISCLTLSFELYCWSLLNIYLLGGGEFILLLNTLLWDVQA